MFNDCTYEYVAKLITLYTERHYFSWVTQSCPHASPDHNTIFLHSKYSIHCSCKVALEVNEWMNECKFSLALPAKLLCTFPTTNFVKIQSIRKETCGQTLPFTWCKECTVNSRSKHVFRPQNTQIAECILHWWYLEMLKNLTTNFP